VLNMTIEQTIKIIQPSNSINAANAQEFQQKLISEISNATTPVVVVNMKEVEYVDSAGLMALVSGMNLSRNLGKRLVICNTGASVRMVFELTQLDEAFEVFKDYQDVEAAIA
jgi:anti-sigma B factor antagonist